MHIGTLSEERASFACASVSKQAVELGQLDEAQAAAKIENDLKN